MVKKNHIIQVSGQIDLRNILFNVFLQRKRIVVMCQINGSRKTNWSCNVNEFVGMDNTVNIFGELPSGRALISAACSADNYEMTDCAYMNPERKALRNKRKVFPDSGKIYTHRCEAFWKDIEVK